MGNVSLGSIRREEIVEKGRVEWPNSLISEIVIVSLDFWAFVVMGLLDHSLDQSAVLLAKGFHGIISVPESWLVGGNEKSIKLFFLVPLSIFLYNDLLREVDKQLISESGQGVVLFTTEVGEDLISLLGDISIVSEHP